MSGGKKRSGFQITSVTSDLNKSPTGQSSSIAVRSGQSEASSCSPQGSSSQPTTPFQKRKHVCHEALGLGSGCSSRFRVVRLPGGGTGGCGRGESYQRGRWTCMEFMEQQKKVGFRQVMNSMRHAHSLESLEMIGQDREGSGVYSQDNAHLLVYPLKGIEVMGLVPRSGPPSPTHHEPINIQLPDRREPVRAQGLDSTPPPPPRPRNLPPLQLDVDAAGRVGPTLRLTRTNTC